VSRDETIILCRLAYRVSPRWGPRSQIPCPISHIPYPRCLVPDPSIVRMCNPSHLALGLCWLSISKLINAPQRSLCCGRVVRLVRAILKATHLPWRHWKCAIGPHPRRRRWRAGDACSWWARPGRRSIFCVLKRGKETN